MVSSEVKNLFCSIWKVVNPRNYATNTSQALIFSILSNKNHPKPLLLWPEYMTDQKTVSALLLGEVITNIKNRCKYLSTK